MKTRSEANACEDFIADKFRASLERRYHRRYWPPQRLDSPGQRGLTGKTPDHLLPGRGCRDAVLELKRVISKDVGLERRIEAEVTSACSYAGFKLTKEHLFTFTSYPPRVPVQSSQDYADFLKELAAAAAATRNGGEFTSARPVPFYLLRVPGEKIGPRITAVLYRDISKECQRFLKDASEKFGPWRDLTELRVLLLLSSDARADAGMVFLWMKLLKRQTGVCNITHVYHVCFDPRGATLTGLWPQSCQQSAPFLTADECNTAQCWKYMKP